MDFLHPLLLTLYWWVWGLARLTNLLRCGNLERNVFRDVGDFFWKISPASIPSLKDVRIPRMKLVVIGRLKEEARPSQFRLTFLGVATGVFIEFLVDLAGEAVIGFVVERVRRASYPVILPVGGWTQLPRALHVFKICLSHPINI